MTHRHDSLTPRPSPADLVATGTLPAIGFLRLRQIIGDPKAIPPIPALIPVSRSKWYDGIRKGIYPAPTKLGPRTSAWNVESIRVLIERLSSSPDAKLEPQTPSDSVAERIRERIAHAKREEQ